MTVVTEESLRKCPPNLRRLLALHNNSLVHAAKVIGADRSRLGKIARGQQKMSDEYAGRIDAALANGHAPAPKPKSRAGGKRGPLVPKDPLLRQLLEKYGDPRQAGKALGYTSPAQVYLWNNEPDKFTETSKQRVRDLLDGKVLMPVKKPIGGKKKLKGLDKGELGFAIVTVSTDTGERLMDLAMDMGGRMVFQRKLEGDLLLLIWHFENTDDMMDFRSFASRRNAEITTP